MSQTGLSRMGVRIMGVILLFSAAALAAASESALQAPGADKTFGKDNVSTPVVQYGYGPLSSNVACSPDGTKFLTGSGDGKLRLFDLGTGDLIRTFTGHTGAVRAVAFSPDGSKLLSGAGYLDNTAKLWDAATGAELRTFAGHTWYVSSVAFSPDGTKVLTGSSDNTAKLWDAATGAETDGSSRDPAGTATAVYPHDAPGRLARDAPRL